MSPHDPHTLPDDLARHAGLLRAVARGVLGDRELVDDVVQQAYLQALARPPEGRGLLRAWLARVVRNLALNTARGEARRAGRERAVARPELDSAGERAALELTLQREVAAALAELEEPYRTVVHLRYFRGLAPAAIAAELDVPQKTVETRLTRAHARLRTRLARAWDEQDERARAVWLAAVPAGKGIGGLLMAKTIAWVGVGGALVAGLVWTWRGMGDDRARAEASTGSELPLESPPTMGASVAETSERELAVVEPEPAPAEAEPEPLVDPDVELRTALTKLGLVLDRSLDGRIDPGAILDAALLLVEHEIGEPRPELELNGALAIPLEGLPEGVHAELNVGKPFSDRPPALVIRLSREGTFAHGGYERQGAEVRLLISVDGAGEPKSLSLMTSLELTDAAQTRADQAGSFDVTYGATLNSTLADGSWKLQTVANVGTAIPDGLHQRIVYRDVPQVLEGGPWPRTDDIGRLGARLRELHELAKSRSGR